ncbi:MAG: DUF4263 domain-containing protein [Methylococcales bacterium]|nr:DUF4263 domain-containing protein [Methylococcales bacterium]
MNLYERDYSKLTKEEELAWQNIKNEEIVSDFGNMQIRKNLFHQYPKAARHFSSYFPNHYLDIVELRETESLITKLNEFFELLNSDKVNEQQILKFINHKHGYFLVYSILKQYFRFGHHGAYLFPEFQLGNSYKVDYLIVGLSSGGWEFVFVELESPTGKITRQNGEIGEVFQKGLRQIEDWDVWLDANYQSLKETFNKHKHIEKALPDEFINMDKSRLHFVVVAGRRDDFKEKTYRIRRKKLDSEKTLILHYDNIIDSARNIIGSSTY